MHILDNGQLLGRELAFFHHISGTECGYMTPQTDTFAILHPKNEQPGVRYPLYVVFHSAGHDVYSAIGCTWAPGNHDIYHVPEDMFGLFLDCRANPGDWWWGGIDANGNGDPSRHGTELQPVENRCIHTIRHVMTAYPVDPMRVYGVGNSMGGSGVLGIGTNHGDLFAAILANVPAGVEHVVDRCCLLGDKPEGFTIPDPPVVVDYSAQNDSWSRGHEKLYRGMRENRYALIGYFGPFGHENNLARMRAVNDLILWQDMLSLRLNEAYPAFTNAASDDKNPWENTISDNAAGQVNAYFCWKNRIDMPDKLEIELSLMHKEDWQTEKQVPTETTADVTLRRIQRFAYQTGDTIAYTFGSQTGSVIIPDSGVITIPELHITQTENVLCLYHTVL